MAERSVFISKNEYPYFEEIRVEFPYFGGFALSQRRKSQISLHQNFLKKFPQEKVLEISSASLHSLGFKLSAMNLSKRTLLGCTSVESAFQSSRIYRDDIGPFPELLFLDGKECKKIVKEKSQGLHSYQYRFDGMDFSAPDYYISLFYNYLYLNGLCEPENKEVAEQLVLSGYSQSFILKLHGAHCCRILHNFLFPMYLDIIFISPFLSYLIYQISLFFARNCKTSFQSLHFFISSSEGRTATNL